VLSEAGCASGMNNQRIGKRDLKEKDVIFGKRFGLSGSKFSKALSRWVPAYAAAKAVNKRDIVANAAEGLLQMGFRFLVPDGKDTEKRDESECFVEITDRKQIEDRVQRNFRTQMKAPKSLKNAAILPRMEIPEAMGRAVSAGVKAQSTARNLNHSDKSSPREASPAKGTPVSSEPLQLPELRSDPSFSFSLSGDDGAGDMLSSLLGNDLPSLLEVDHGDNANPKGVNPVPRTDTAVNSLGMTIPEKPTVAVETTHRATSGKLDSLCNADALSELTEHTPFRDPLKGFGDGLLEPLHASRLSPISFSEFEGLDTSPFDDVLMLDRTSGFEAGRWADEDDDNTAERPASFFDLTSPGLAHRTVVTEDPSLPGGRTIVASSSSSSASSSSSSVQQLGFVTYHQLDLWEQKMGRKLNAYCARAFGRLDERLQVLREDKIKIREQLNANKRENQDLRERLAVLEYKVKTTASSSSSEAAQRSHQSTGGDSKW